jgi:DNA-directed RNA polymerase specialized sigma24 family protein
LARAAAGHTEAFSQLRHRHSMSLYALAYGIVIDAADAQEIVDATFAEAWLKAARYDLAKGSVHAWLAGMARSRAQGVVRAREWPRRVAGWASAEELRAS